MASSPTRREIDRISGLPDDLLIKILALLPTCVAARTSAVSRLFRHLWEASPTVDLTTNYNPSNFAAMAKSALLSREPSLNPLLSLRLEACASCVYDLPYSFFRRLILKARSLGLRHLDIARYMDREPLLSPIFSISSLESLSLDSLPRSLTTLPSAITLTRLKSLSFSLYNAYSPQVNQLLSELPSLEHLRVMVALSEVLTLSSCTVRKLELYIDTVARTDFVGFSIPSLEVLHLRTSGFLGRAMPRIIEGDVPLLRKAFITIRRIREKDVPAVAGLLKCISHAEELSLHIEEYLEEKYPFPILVEPGKHMPSFPNLKHLEVKMCFHEHNLHAVMRMLQHCAALQSLKLLHLDPDPEAFEQKRKRSDWESKLPQNYVHFRDLHSREYKGFIESLNMESSSKRMRI